MFLLIGKRNSCLALKRTCQVPLTNHLKGTVIMSIRISNLEKTRKGLNEHDFSGTFCGNTLQNNAED